MTQLIDLIVADDLRTQQVFKVSHVGYAAYHAADAGTGEGDLAGGSKLEETILAAGFPGNIQNIGEGYIFAFKFMDTVGVIPHDHKIRGGGLHLYQVIDHFLRVDDPVWIRVFGYAPHTLYHGISNGFFYSIHVRAFFRHGNVLHGDAQAFTDLEVPVIAGSGAEEPDLILLGPGTGRMKQTVDTGLAQQIIHQLQRSASAVKNVFFFDTQHIGKIGPAGVGAHKFTVIAHIQLSIHAVFSRIENGENITDHVQLRFAGLSAGHIQFKAHGLDFFILFLQLGKKGTLFASFHLGVGFHKKILSFIRQQRYFIQGWCRRYHSRLPRLFPKR